MKTDLESSLDKDVLTVFRAMGYATFRKKKLTGKSGVEHTIDIVAEKAGHLTAKRLLIECKPSEGVSALKIDEIIVFWGKVFDIGAEGLIIAASKPTESARRFAEFYGIRIMEAGGMGLKKKIMYTYI